MKGIYELRPPWPRYTATWDLSTVLNFFRKGVSVSELSLKELTFQVDIFVSPAEWTKVSNNQIPFNRKYGAL